MNQGIRRRVQQHVNGCGIACVAMIANVPYRKAAKKMPTKCRSEGTTIRAMKAALSAFGIRARYESIKDRKYRNLKFDAVLCGNVAADTHWVVWDHKRKLKLDPYKGATLRFECTSFFKIIGSA
jgi:ABC-type bacteriocin/lantibiotic exporter with double-glycine peptidase domain